MRSVLVGLVILMRAPPAGAQVQDSLAQLRDIKSPGHAAFLSVAGTAAPIAAGALLLEAQPGGTGELAAGVLIAAGAVVGPSLGHFYSHKLGWLIPRALVGAGALAIVLSQGEQDELGTGLMLAYVGAVPVLMLMVRDIAGAPAAAGRYNARAHTLGLRIAPRQSGSDRRLNVGLQLAL